MQKIYEIWNVNTTTGRSMLVYAAVMTPLVIAMWVIVFLMWIGP